MEHHTKLNSILSIKISTPPCMRKQSSSLSPSLSQSRDVPMGDAICLGDDTSTYLQLISLVLFGLSLGDSDWFDHTGRENWFTSPELFSSFLLPPIHMKAGQ